jgi:transcription elongation factor Elf1
MTDEATLDFRDRPFTCPYCGPETVVQLPPEMETILISRETCEQCGRAFLIENDVVRPLPQ